MWTKIMMEINNFLMSKVKRQFVKEKIRAVLKQACSLSLSISLSKRETSNYDVAAQFHFTWKTKVAGTTVRLFRAVLKQAYSLSLSLFRSLSLSQKEKRQTTYTKIFVPKQWANPA